LARDIANPSLTLRGPLALWNVDGAIGLTYTLLFEESLNFSFESRLKAAEVAFVLEGVKENWRVFISDSGANIVIYASCLILERKLVQLIDKRA
jgi:hypothetical protein